MLTVSSVIGVIAAGIAAPPGARESRGDRLPGRSDVPQGRLDLGAPDDHQSFHHGFAGGRAGAALAASGAVAVAPAGGSTISPGLSPLSAIAA